MRLIHLIRAAGLTSAISGMLALGGCNSGGQQGASATSENPTATLTENSVGVIDAATNSVVAGIPVGRDPLDVVTADGSVWVANVGDKSVTQIDAATRKVVRTIKLTGAPTGLSAGEGGLWVTDGRAGTVQRIDMDTGDPGGTRARGTARAAPLFAAYATADPWSRESHAS